MFCSRVELMKVHLINPSHVSFGVGVITPRWLVRARLRDTAELRDASADGRNARDRSTPRRFSVATSSASASIRAMRCGDTRSAQPRAPLAPTSCTEGFTRPSIRTRHTTSAAPIRS